MNDPSSKKTKPKRLSSKKPKDEIKEKEIPTLKVDKDREKKDEKDHREKEDKGTRISPTPKTHRAFEKRSNTLGTPVKARLHARSRSDMAEATKAIVIPPKPEALKSNVQTGTLTKGFLMSRSLDSLSTLDLDSRSPTSSSEEAPPRRYKQELEDDGSDEAFSAEDSSKESWSNSDDSHFSDTSDDHASFEEDHKPHKDPKKKLSIIKGNVGTKAPLPFIPDVIFAKNPIDEITTRPIPHPSPAPTTSVGIGRPAVLSKEVIRKGSDWIVRLNIGGTIFETWASSLLKYPSTLLGTMLSSRNKDIVLETNEYFFDRDPRVFEVILNFYRTGKLISPSWIPIEQLHEELRFFAMDVLQDTSHTRLSADLLKVDYRNQILDASQYKKIARQKLLSEHNGVVIKILDKFSRAIERKASQGENACQVEFRSPLHYNDSTPRNIFNIISKNEIRELITEILEQKSFNVVEVQAEYSKTKATDIIGLADQVVNYNDPKYFLFSVKW